AEQELEDIVVEAVVQEAGKFVERESVEVLRQILEHAEREIVALEGDPALVRSKSIRQSQVPKQVVAQATSGKLRPKQGQPKEGIDWGAGKRGSGRFAERVLLIGEILELIARKHLLDAAQPDHYCVSL